MNKSILKDYILTIESGTRGKGGAVSEGVPSLGAEHLNKDGSINWSADKMKYISSDLFETLKSGIVQDEDVLIVKDGATTGKVAYVEKPPYNSLAINEHIFLMRTKSTLISKYLFYYLMSSKGNRAIMKNFRGATVGGITKTFINMPIDIPSIKEQKQIIEKLDLISSLISRRKNELQKLDLLVKSRFTELCGDPISNPFKWEKKKIAEVCTKIGSGATPKGGKASYISEGISLIRSMNVHNGYFKYDELAHISEKQAKELQNVCIEENDVLLNITGASVARSCVVPNNILPARVNQHVSILRANLQILDPIFLNLVLINDNYQHYLLSVSESNGATRQALTKQQIENLVIPIPPLECQSRMACYFKRINKSKVEIQKSLDKLEMLKKSLMQQYFG